MEGRGGVMNENNYQNNRWHGDIARRGAAGFIAARAGQQADNCAKNAKSH